MTVSPSNDCFRRAAAPVLTWGALLHHRGYLVRYAERRLLDPTLAEDLVHDVFEAVVTGRARFAGRSALRSWLVGVLKHKIVDLIRERSGHSSLQAPCGGDEDDDAGDETLECPAPGPQDRAEQRQQVVRALARIAALPDSLRVAVELRLLEDHDTEEVCRRLSISSENLFVRLHRARKQLLS